LSAIDRYSFWILSFPPGVTGFILPPASFCASFVRGTLTYNFSSPVQNLLKQNLSSLLAKNQASSYFGLPQFFLAPRRVNPLQGFVRTAMDWPDTI